MLLPGKCDGARGTCGRFGRGRGERYFPSGGKFLARGDVSVCLLVEILDGHCFDGGQSFSLGPEASLNPEGQRR